VSAHQQWRRVADGFRGRFPKLAELMDEAEEEEEVLSYASFPAEHWQKIWSNNPLERLKARRSREGRTWWGSSRMRQR
jgi:putative transposase